jgi:hypothetical protein
MAPSDALPRSDLSAVLCPPSGYTVRIEETAGVQFYRAIRVHGPQWISARLRGTYSAAELDARLHSVGVKSGQAAGAK